MDQLTPKPQSVCDGIPLTEMRCFYHEPSELCLIASVYQGEADIYLFAIEESDEELDNWTLQQQIAGRLKMPARISVTKPQKIHVVSEMPEEVDDTLDNYYLHSVNGVLRLFWRDIDRAQYLEINPLERHLAEGYQDLLHELKQAVERNRPGEDPIELLNEMLPHTQEYEDTYAGAAVTSRLCIRGELVKAQQPYNAPNPLDMLDIDLYHLDAVLAQMDMNQHPEEPTAPTRKRYLYNIYFHDTKACAISLYEPFRQCIPQIQSRFPAITDEVVEGCTYSEAVKAKERILLDSEFELEDKETTKIERLRHFFVKHKNTRDKQDLDHALHALQDFCGISFTTKPVFKPGNSLDILIQVATQLRQANLANTQNASVSSVLRFTNETGGQSEPQASNSSRKRPYSPG